MASDYTGQTSIRNETLGADRVETLRVGRLLCLYSLNVPEVVYEDGTARAQALKKENHLCYYALMEEMEKLTGNGAVLNTSLNRRGEAVYYTPEDALNMFFGSDLEYLIMEDVLVTE